MEMTMTKDLQRAQMYFENKMAFTTGPVELFKMMEAGNVCVVDVREAEDYEKGHIPGAMNMPHDCWENPRGLSRDKTNVIYCYTQQCHLAAKACMMFASKGFPVMEMEGGFETWKACDMDIEQGQASTMSKTPAMMGKGSAMGKEPAMSNAA